MMTTSATGTPRHRIDARHARGFTLVELILVMALIVIAVSMIMPTMSKFFGGRSLDAEVKRFMSLMHYGQSRAVSEGVPMVLWVDTAHNSYGLNHENTFGPDRDAVENDLGKGLTIGLAKNTSKVTIANSQTGRIQTGQALQRKNKMPAIYFEPDGTINNALSVGGVSLQDVNSAAPVWIAPVSSSDLGYDVTSQNPNSRR